MIVRTVDYHTAGEPFRIVVEGLPPVPGDSVAERRAIAIGAGGSPTRPRPGRLDTVRQLLTREPRGHAGMYGGFLVPPDDDEAHLGVLFFHKDGYSTACGHGTMALGAWAVDSGLVPAPADGTARVRIDVPSGRVTALVHRSGGRTTAVAFRNVPTRVLARKRSVATSAGPLEVDLADSGAVYASVAVDEVTAAGLPWLTVLGREVRAALAPEYDLYGVIFHQELPDTPAGPAQRNVTVFADGQLDRSPCGSGTSARLALLAEDGRLGPDQELRHESVIGTVFTGRVLGQVPGRPADGVLTEVTGQAHRTGEHRFTLDQDDALGTGFLL
ncbi:proline racemase family protein [Kitasatospora sp. NBC_01287]|uniref:proline racemase family protein n=1 Tax=Kitasatospora sp. NBC_01287 TaxID=2903573 RepID=UPI002259DD75|nr:proline racemase family protein [Kitasatospora sp. NBC_01287]MCX4750176.1 proline racemase family protein [Kitasatospora sp. NBC_01287]